MDNSETRSEQDAARSRVSREPVSGNSGYVDGRVTHLVDLTGTGSVPAAHKPAPAVPPLEEPIDDIPNTDVSPSS